MPSFARWRNRLISRLAARFSPLARRLVAAYRPRESRGEIPWTHARKPLARCRVAVVTTAGVHHRSQSPFDMRDPEGDPSFRILQADRIGTDYRITHDYYDHADADRDFNIVMPLDRIRELVEAGHLGSLTPTHYSFMGHIDGPHVATLEREILPQLIARLRAESPDFVFLTPT